MVIDGQWTLHYDWDCTGSYGQVGITFNSDGTFSTSGLAGKWTQQDGMILFQFNQWDSIKTTYGGNLAGNAMVGTMSTFAGLNGCWYAIREGSTTMLARERKPEFDESGNKVKK